MLEFSGYVIFDILEKNTAIAIYKQTSLADT